MNPMWEWVPKKQDSRLKTFQLVWRRSVESMEAIWNYVQSILIGGDNYTAEIHCNPKVEYLRLITEFPPEEVVRLQERFKELTEGEDAMTLAVFMKIESIDRNPLNRRIAKAFGFINDEDTLTSDEFIKQLATFNSPGKKDEKLKLMFRLHDADADGFLSAEDITDYLKIISGDDLEEDEVDQAVNNLFLEFDRATRKKGLSVTDFNLVVGPTDFHTKMFIPV